MNSWRVMRTSNVLLLLSGYQMHWFDAKQQRHRISLPGALHIFVLGCVYAGCFAQHWRTSALLQTLLDVSPFLHRLTRLQLLLGVKVFAYAVYASVRAVGVANALTESLPLQLTKGRRCDKSELLAYVLLFSTFLVLFCFGLYIGIELKFVLPPLKDVMIGLALFLPHLVLAGALRFYSILAWLTRDRLQDLQLETDELLNVARLKTELQLVAGSGSVSIAGADSLLRLCQQLQQLATHFCNVFDALQHSLLLLLLVNANCLLFGVYAQVYYRSTWHVLFDVRRQRVFYAGIASIYACIGCDYACLLLAQSLLQQKRSQFRDSLGGALTQRDALPKRLRHLAKDMRETLSKSFHCKFLSIWRFDVANFTLLQLLQLLIIALIVIYHYLNDAIQLTNERFDSSDDE